MNPSHHINSRTDTHLTSTGVGHHWRDGYYFPETTFKSTMKDSLPPVLAKMDEMPKDQYFETTNGKVHDRKFLGGPYGNGKSNVYKKAPALYKVNYVKDHAEKLGKGGWRKPLTMGNQQSETHAEFNARPGLSEPIDFKGGPQPYNLQAHQNEGPSKQMVPSTRNEAMAGKDVYPNDKGVLNLNDMYTTTNQATHRKFKERELKGYPEKNVPTYWECEEYPKVWGHGLHENPLPKNTVPREKLPMVDSMQFKHRTKYIPRLPNAMVPVPHGGLKSEKTDRYQNPMDVKRAKDVYIPVDTPFVLPAPGAKSAYMCAPQMYKTEYQNVGGKQIVTV